MRFTVCYLGLICLVLGLVGCGAQTIAAQPQPETIALLERASESRTLTVFAAASLTEAFTTIADEFQANHPHTQILLNFAGSQTLRLQIEEGARADVFASANEEHTEALHEAKLIERPILFSQNRLIVIGPASNPGSLNSLDDLAKPGLKLVLAGPDVPVGRYARQALEKLNSNPDLAPDFMKRVLGNLVSEEENVKAVVAKIQLGEADAGIVYSSDVTPAVTNDLTSVMISPEYNIVANYPIAVVAGSTQQELAQQFIDLVLSPEGQAILADFGFQPVWLQVTGDRP